MPKYPASPTIFDTIQPGDQLRGTYQGEAPTAQISVICDPPPRCSLGAAANHLALDVTEVVLAVVVARISLAECLVCHCSAWLRDVWDAFELSVCEQL